MFRPESQRREHGHQPPSADFKRGPGYNHLPWKRPRAIGAGHPLGHRRHRSGGHAAVPLVLRTPTAPPDNFSKAEGGLDPGRSYQAQGHVRVPNDARNRAA